MATKETIEALYNRYLNNDISVEELEGFLQMLHTPEGELTISSLMDGTWQEMFETQQPAVVPMYKRTWYRVAAAAIILLLLSVGGYFIFNRPAQKQIAQTEKRQQPYKNDIAPGGNKAILTLANGTQIILDSAANGALTQQGNTKIIKLDSGRLAYNSLNEKPGEVLYNTISTPRGGQYQIVLADGSKVWLNAASSLRFPASFTGKERKVELTGEGYFEVAKNAAMPFRVNANGMQVEVLGTHFNINAYNDEDVIKTTLLEGSVKVREGASGTIIKPGQQALVENQGNPLISKIRVQTVDVDGAVAWKNGYFSFDKADLPTVMRQIARWYDVEISYEGNIPKREFGGKIDRNSNASQVLKILEESKVHFRIEGKKIIVMP